MTRSCDVAVVGYGPTGMVLAALLGRLGHRVVVLEKHRDLYNLPRAACFDDEIMRLFQKLGITDEVALGAVAQPDYEWVNADGRTLVEIEYDDPAQGGWAALYMMYQPHVETVLDRLCKSLATVEVEQGVTIDAFEPDPDGVLVRGAHRDGSPVAVHARFVVGADGGASFVRRWLATGSSDYGFQENWLVCDFAKRRPLDDVPTFRQVCDPAQPISIVRIGPDHHRFSFALEPGETPEAATDPKRVWQRVSGYLQPEDAELVRVANYVFRSRVADVWRRDRVLLAGDAAHEMPPFLAQGMCSGMRDSHNLAWKLDLVLRDQADAALLDTYQPEREPHVRFITEKAIELGRVQTIRDPEAARARDERLLALRAADQAPEKLRYPDLSGGLAAPSGPSGEVFAQARVRAGGREARFDDAVGVGPCILVRDPAVLAALTSEARERWAALGGRLAALGEEGAPPREAGVTLLQDVEGAYARWFAERACSAVLVRPDWYTFGTAGDALGLAGLLEAFLVALRPAAPARALPGADARPAVIARGG